MNDLTTVVELIAQWAWVGWIVLIALFLVIEMLTLDFTFLMLATGSAAGLVAGLLAAPLWVQLIVAAIAAVALILFLRPPLLRRLHRGEDPTPSNVDALLGLAGHVLHEVTETTGQVKLANGDVWTARTHGGAALGPNTRITVASIDGATAIVVPASDDSSPVTD